MPLRTKLLLSFISLALIPLMALGVIAYVAATDSLGKVERDSLGQALQSVDLALHDIQNSLAQVNLTNANWSDLHDQIAKDTLDQPWFDKNFGLQSAGSITKINNLAFVGVWHKLAVTSAPDQGQKLVYSVGSADPHLFQQLGAADATATQVHLVGGGQDIYFSSAAPIQTDDGSDPNGVLVMGQKLGQAEVQHIKDLTGYDVALYQGSSLIAATQQNTATPSPDSLKSALNGQTVFDVTNADFALAYKPLQDAKGNTTAVLVVWRPRSAVVAAQGSIAGTVALTFAITALLAVLAALVLRNSIAKPLLALASSADRIAAGDLSPQVNAVPAKDELGRLASAFNQMAEKVNERVTETESQNERLEALDEYRLNLLQAIAQALNSPLNHIQQSSQTLHMEMYGTLNEAQKESVAGIRRAANTERVLLADLIDFAQAQRKRLHLVPQRLTLDNIVQDVTPAVKTRYAAKNIRLTTELPPDLPQLYADPIRMRQILDQTLDWAFRECRAGAEIKLSAERQAGNVEITISESSAGLTVAQQATLFDLFNQLGSQHSDSNQAQGTLNLGLAFVKAIIEQQGGTIQLTAIAGTGNVLKYTIPLAG